MADDSTVKSSSTNEENNDSIPPPSPEKPPQEEGRRSVPRLREIMRRQRKDSDTQPDAPLLNFQYNDTDSLQDELSELYSYTEEDEFKENASAFQTSFTEYMKNETVLWCDMELVQKRGFIFYVLEKLEVVDIEERRIASRTLLYLAQGMYRDQEDFNECTAMMKENAMILYKCGVYSCVQQLLVMEAENPEAVQLAMQKPSISIADSIDLRQLLLLFCNFVL